MVKVRIDHEKCDGRGTCVNIYPVDVFEIREKNAVSLIQMNALCAGHAQSSIQTEPLKS